ncbi:MAG: hypothetical protein WCO00_10490 [Rhodospirillaceae bacterium]
MGQRILGCLLGTTMALASAAAMAESRPAGIGIGETAKGPVLTESRGLSLYVFDKDDGGAPACYDKCTELWPPLVAAPGLAPGGAFTAVARKDGKAQLAYKGHPLYTWHKDAAPGEIGGDGFRDVWHLARP